MIVVSVYLHKQKALYARTYLVYDVQLSYLTIFYNLGDTFYLMSTVKMPTVKMPTVKMLTVKMPTVKMPTVKMSTVKMSTIKMSTVKMSTVKMLTVKMLTVKMSTVKMSTSKLSTSRILGTCYVLIFFKGYHPTPLRDLVSRPIALVSFGVMQRQYHYVDQAIHIYVGT
jgi:energy-converting hydrogenase Eha subunit E